MQVPELRDLMKKIYGYSRGNKHELINKIWMLAGVVPHVSYGILIVMWLGTGAATCQCKLWQPGG